MKRFKKPEVKKKKTTALLPAFMLRNTMDYRRKKYGPVFRSIAPRKTKVKAPSKLKISNAVRKMK